MNIGELKDKKIIIVGASSGIGKEMALIYASKGARVGITGRREELLTEIKNQFPERIHISVFDVMKQDNIQKIKDLTNHLGGLDLLIYNSGYGEISSRIDWDIEKTTMMTNVSGFLEITGYAFNYFVEKGKGQIAITSSVAATRGSSMAPAYSASKAFVSNYAEGLSLKAFKLKKLIYVTDIRPGFIKTKMASGNNQFWVASPQAAAMQIVEGIASRKRILYVTKKWRLIAWMLKIIPFFILKRIL